MSNVETGGKSIVHGFFSFTVDFPARLVRDGTVVQGVGSLHKLRKFLQYEHLVEVEANRPISDKLMVSK
jgi:hypothetical protein